MNGVVTDQNGAVVSGANVALTNVDTNVERVAISNGTGDYFFNEVPPARYTLSFSATGFEKEKISAFDVGVAQVVTINAVLKVGSVQQSVTVEAVNTEVEASTAQLGAVIGTQSVNDLPLDGRNFTQLLDLTPGVTPISTGQNSSASNTAGLSTSAEVTYSFPSVNGAYNRSNLYLTDGMNNNNSWYNTYSVPPIIDTIDQFKINSHSDAQYGGVIGGVVNVATKSGTNSYHGSGWEYLRSSFMDAKPFISAPPSYHLDTYGGQMGGPVEIPHLYNGRNKTFFEIGYEGTHFTRANGTLELIPTAAQLGESTFGGPQTLKYADFSSASTGVTKNGTCNATDTTADAGNCQLWDPTAGGNFAATPYRPFYPGNQVPVSEFQSTQLAFINAVFGSNGPYTIPGISPYRRQLRDHFAHHPAHRQLHRANRRAHRQPGLYLCPLFRMAGKAHVAQHAADALQHHVDSSAAIRGELEPRLQPHDQHAGAIRESPCEGRLDYAIYKPQPVADLRLLHRHVRRLCAEHRAPGHPDRNGRILRRRDQHQLLQPCRDSRVVRQRDQSPGQPPAAGGRRLGRRQLHLLSAPGHGDFQRRVDGQLRGKPRYTVKHRNVSGQSGFGLVDFLLDYPNSEAKRNVLLTERPGGIGSIYVQDSWKMNPKLTVNYGLRYDRSVIPAYGTEASVGLQGSIETGDPDFNTGIYIVQQLPPLCSVRGHAPCLPSATLPADVVVAQGGRILHGSKMNFGPRLGFAYRVNNGLSVRGGIGMLWDNWSALIQMPQNYQGSWPDTGTLQINNTNTPQAGGIYVSAQNPFAANPGNLPAATPLGSSNVNYMVDPLWRNPYSEQFNFGIEKQLWSNEHPERELCGLGNASAGHWRLLQHRHSVRHALRLRIVQCARVRGGGRTAVSLRRSAKVVGSRFRQRNV